MRYPATDQIRPVEKDGLLFYEFPLFDPFRDRFLGVFSSRIGGVSQGCYSQLNLGISRGDDPEALLENLRRFAQATGFSAERTVLSQQTHTTNLREAKATDAGKGYFLERGYTDVDGLYTQEKQLPLVTMYADCTPLLFFAADKNIAATSHSGWRGTVSGMAKVTVEKLLSLGAKAEHIYAAIGPSAGPCCYQVDAETAQAFRQVDASTVRTDPKENGKYLADMWRTNRILLERAGLPEKNIAVGGLCTICHADVFFSHRIQGEARGALAAVVMLK